MIQWPARRTTEAGAGPVSYAVSPLGGVRAAMLLAFASATGVATAEARFAVVDEAVARGFGPFTATVEGFGAGARLVWSGSGFEPAVVRTRWVATEDAPDRVVASPDDAAHWDTLRSGFFDSAQVDVYRVSNGLLERVRVDRVAPGGHQASGWTSLLPDGRLLAPDGQTFTHVFAPWNRPDAAYWFAVQAVGSDGAVSAPSQAVQVISPAKIPNVSAAAPALVPAPEGMPRPEAFPVTGGPPPPHGLLAEMTESGSVRLAWTAEGPSPVGWRVLIDDEPPEAHRGFFARLEGGATGTPIRAGDLVILSKTFETSSRSAYHTNRVWRAWGDIALTRQPLVDFFPDEEMDRTWRLVRHAADTPVEESGETYLELDLSRGAAARIGAYNHAGTGQHSYEVLEPGRTYRLEFWAKADRPKRIRAFVEGPYGRPGPTQIRPQTVLAGLDWRKFAVRFTPQALLADDGLGWMGLEIEGPGRVAIDNLRLHPDDTLWLDLDTVDYARLEASGVEALRTHGLIKTFRRTYDLGQLTNPGGATGIDLMNTLPQTLAIMERAGVDPWLQIEPHLRPEEWLGLVEYLAAPAPDAESQERPWAAKRAMQGRAAPWTEAFERIYLEIGNETWNGLFTPWTFTSMPDAASGETLGRGTVYGLFQEHVIRTLRSSPWWGPAKLEDKVVFVLGGWGGTPYGQAAATASSSSELLTIAAYNGGWDAGEGPPRATPRGFFEVLNDVSQSAVPDADLLAAEASEIGAARGQPLAIGTYEAGPGYALDGLNGDRVSDEQAAEQELVMKSVAAGTATLDAFLARSERGFTVQNFFTFGEGRYWRSHARRVDGGAAHPAWELLALQAGLGRGEMLRVETLAVPRADVPATAWRPAVADAPLVGAYAARDGDRLTLTLISRRVPGWPDRADGDASVVATVDLPFARADRITRHRMTGAHDATNLEGPAIGIVAEPVPVDWLEAGRLRVPDLPPGQAEIYVFEGISNE